MSLPIHGHRKKYHSTRPELLDVWVPQQQGFAVKTGISKTEISMEMSMSVPASLILSPLFANIMNKGNQQEEIPENLPHQVAWMAYEDLEQTPVASKLQISAGVYPGHQPPIDVGEYIRRLCIYIYMYI